MYIELSNVKITVETRYCDSDYEVLILTIPLPGGFCQYEVEISKQMADNINLAKKLVNGDKK